MLQVPKDYLSQLVGAYSIFAVHGKDIMLCQCSMCRRMHNGKVNSAHDGGDMSTQNDT